MGSERRRHLGVLVVLFLLGLPLVTPRVYAVDEIQYFAYVRSIWMDGDLDFSNEYRRLAEPDAVEWGGLLNDDGEAVNFAAMGCGLLWSPFFLAGHVTAVALGAPTDGFSRPYVAAVSYGSTIYGFLGLLLLYHLAAELVSPRPALLGTLGAWWATALPFYLYATPPMSHATSLFVVSLLVWTWWRWPRPDLGQAAALGFLVGLATLVREQNLLFVVLPMVSLTRPAWRRNASGGERLRALASLLLCGAVVAAVLLPQMFVWQRIFGEFGPPSQRTGMLVPWPRFLLPLLLSTNRGLLAWHPIWIAGFIGIGLLHRRNRPAAAVSGSPGFTEATRPLWPLALAFFLQILFLASTPNWSGGMAFGQRRLLGSAFVVVLGVAAIAPRIGLRWSVAGLAVLVWLNLSLLVQFGTGMIPRDAGFEWRTVVHNHLVRVPAAAVHVASRYLLHRRTFFGHTGLPSL